MTEIQTKIFERVLSMAQMHQIGVLHRGPNMLWTCRWKEGGRESSMSYELQKAPEDQSLRMRFHYRVLCEGEGKNALLDYNVALRTSLSYKRKTWYWFICPLVVNSKPCKRRVRNLYFLPSSDYFGCKHCRDMMVRSLPQSQRIAFRRTEAVSVQESRRPSSPFVPDLQMGWRPSTSREICHKCGCLSEGSHCCHCGARLGERAEGNLFQILGVMPNASPQDLRVAFTTRIKEYHPDRVAHLGAKLREVAEREIKHINVAYETLRDPERREEYLREIGGTS